MKIYLGGKMSGLSYEEMYRWRLELANFIELTSDAYNEKVKVINPVDYYNFECPMHQSELEIMNYDLKHVKTSDLMVVSLDGLNTSVGTIIEIYEAYKNEIPVIVFGNYRDYENLHPWVKCCVTRYEEDDIGVVDYIKDFYFS